MSTYHATFLFKATMKDEDVVTSADKITGEIEKLGGKVIEKSNSGVRPFSRILKKQESGTYVTVRFDIPPSQMAALDHRLKLIEEIFRFQILKHVDIQTTIVAEAATADA